VPRKTSGRKRPASRLSKDRHWITHCSTLTTCRTTVRIAVQSINSSSSGGDVSALLLPAKSPVSRGKMSQWSKEFDASRESKVIRGLLSEAFFERSRMAGEISGSRRLLWHVHASLRMVGYALASILIGTKSESKTSSFAMSRLVRGKRKTFKDVVLGEAQLNRIRAVIEFLRNPQQFAKLGVTLSSHILLVGPPGTGKTLLALALVGESNVPCFVVRGTDFFGDHVWEGPSRMRELFAAGRKNAPCIIVIDELDAVGRQRSPFPDLGLFEQEITLSQLLVELDDSVPSDGVIVVAATNRPDLLDDGLTRYGRFGTVVEMSYPGVKEIEELLRVHTRKIPLADDVDFTPLANLIHSEFPQCTGALIFSILNDAGGIAVAKNEKFITQKALLSSFEKAKGPRAAQVERASPEN
jgi:ATP-dependent Zn protease